MADCDALTIDRAAITALGRVAESIGRGSFYQHLLEAIGCCLAHDLSSVMRYSPFTQPDLLLGASYGPEFSLNYARELYRYDPFYRYWKETGRPGVVSLSEVVTTEVDQRRYVRTILFDVSITDEIGLFLPPVGRSSLALFFDRCGGTFTPADVARAQLVYDFVAGLHTAHVNAVFGHARLDDGGTATLLSGPRPTRVLDRSDHEILRNGAWSLYEAKNESALVRSLPELASTGQARIAPDLILHRTALPTTFHLVPCGWVETIEPLGLSPITPNQLAIPDRLGRLLSPREQDIVGLMLRGYPTKKIAGQLGLTQGTVKNYRRRIYDKLDVTTEREVFLSCMCESDAVM